MHLASQMQYRYVGCKCTCKVSKSRKTGSAGWNSGGRVHEHSIATARKIKDAALENQFLQSVRIKIQRCTPSFYTCTWPIPIIAPRRSVDGFMFVHTHCEPSRMLWFMTSHEGLQRVLNQKCMPLLFVNIICAKFEVTHACRSYTCSGIASRCVSAYNVSCVLLHCASFVSRQQAQKIRLD